MSAEHSFDKSVLDKYLKKHLKGFPDGEKELVLRQFTSGILNLTFYLSKDGKEYVLRQRPAVDRIPWMHKIDKEYKILSVLGSLSFPAPRPLLYCEDISVMGTEFYVMEYIEGRLFVLHNFSGVRREDLRAMFESAVATMAKLHELKCEVLELGFLGESEDCLRKRVTYMTHRYKENNVNDDFPSADALIKWLEINVPDDGIKPVIIHSDYKIQNILFNPNEPRLLAVLDWEGVSFGHPLEDLAYFCMAYHIKIQALTQSECVPQPPPEEDILQLYCDLRGMTSPPQHWNYFLAFAFFRVALGMQELQMHISRGLPFPDDAKQMLGLLGPFINIASGLAGLATSK